jgi:polysaccharide export outer membrane protein
MKRNFTSAFVLIVILLSFSCGSTNYQNIPYYQDLNRSSVTQEDIKNYSPFVIQSGDILGINVTSLSPEASAVFNYNLNKVNGNG